MDLAKLRAKSVPLTVKIDGLGELQIAFKPAVYTPRFLDELGELTLPQALCRLVETWDLVDGKDPVPISEAALEDVPLDVLRGILQAIREEIFPNLKRAANTESS